MKTTEKELFIESIEAIQKQMLHDEKCAEAFKIILPNDFTSCYDNHWLCNQLIKILQKEMNDNHKDGWIDFFIYELEFGKKQEGDFRAWERDGTPIDLGDANKLWEFLNRNK